MFNSILKTLRKLDNNIHFFAAKQSQLIASIAPNPSVSNSDTSKIYI